MIVCLACYYYIGLIVLLYQQHFIYNSILINHNYDKNVEVHVFCRIAWVEI